MARPVTSSPTDDTALLAGVARRDSAAWDRFVGRFAPLVLATVQRAGCRQGEDEEVVQTTWQHLYDHAPRIGAPRSLPAWLVRTARHEAWRTVRRRAHGATLEADVGRERAAATDPPAEVDVDRMERAQLVRDGVDALGGRCGPLLRRLFLSEDEPDYGEVSRALDIPIGSIGPTRGRCLTRLAAWLAERGVRGLENHGEPRISGAGEGSGRTR